MTWIEAAAAFFGVLCVAFTIRRSLWCWPTGLVQVALYIAVFYRARLYSDMGLQAVYVVLQVYGWWAWTQGRRDEGEVRVRRLPRAHAWPWLLAGAACSAALGWTMRRYTDADLVYWDAATTVFSLIAQYWMSRRILESWIVWIAVDVVSIGVYGVKELWLTLGLYAVFLGMASAGYVAWRKSWVARARA